MKRVRATPDIRTQIRLAGLDRHHGRLAAAAKLLEVIAKTDEGFVLVCDRLLVVYEEQLAELKGDDAKTRRLLKLIEKTERRRAALSHIYTFPSIYEPGSGAFYRRDVFFDAPSKLPWFLQDVQASANSRDVMNFQEAAPAPKYVGYTPHIDTAPKLEAGEVIVKIFLDGSPFRQGEIGERVVAKVGTTVQAHILTSQHFRVQGETSQSFVVDEDTRTLVFSDFILKKELGKEATGQPFIGAIFTVDGNICGNVKHFVDRDGRAKAGETTDPPLGVPQSVGKQADLSVTVVQVNEREYACLVISPHLDGYREGKSASWTLNGRSEDIVAGYMSLFTAPDTKPQQLVAELKGVGKLLFRDTPSIFKNAFWLLIENKLPLESIAVVSEEPYMPWELMVPNGGPAGQGRSLPLGAEFNVGRWIYQTKTPNRALSLHDSRIIAPKYDDDNALPLSQAEAAAVAEAYAGQVITPAKFEEVSMALCSRSSLLHFICHGEDKGSAGQTLLLDDSDSLTATNLFGIDGVEEAFHTKAPVVFLNACEVGRGNPSLIGTRNFASQFIQLGAQAVIAPLWSVDDTVAHEVALSFYSALKAAPTKPLAEILRDIRKKAYETGKDTYAAYCFFGNPFATAV